MGNELQEAYREIVNPWLGAEEACVQHPETSASWVCPVCEQFFCRNCMTYDPTLEALRCNACAKSETDTKRRRRATSLIRMPAFYVTLVVVLTIVAYMSGATRPTPANLRAADQGKAWQQQRVPRLWIQQARRSRKRADYLRATDRSDEARMWDLIAFDAIHSARSLWMDQPLGPQLLIAEARALGRLERSADGYQLLAEAPELSADDSPVRLHCLAYRGELAVAGGLTDQGVADLTAVLVATQQLSAVGDADVAVTELLGLLAAGIPMMGLTMAVEELAGTDASPAQLKAHVVRLIEANNLAPRFSPTLLPRQLRDVPPSGEGEDLRVRRFDEVP